jgi:hypothetical protein
MAHCCVPNCSNDYRYKDRYYKQTGNVLHFHKISEHLQKEWIHAIRRDIGPNFTVSSHLSIGTIYTFYCTNLSEVKLFHLQCTMKLK